MLDDETLDPDSPLVSHRDTTVCSRRHSRRSARSARATVWVTNKTAISLAMENKLPIVVYNIKKKGFLKRVLTGENVGTLVAD